MIDSPYKGGVDWRGLPIKRPYPWERDVTVCIAAICGKGGEGNQKIVLCSDRKTSSPLGSAEEFLKDRPLDHGWRCLMSGTESHVLRLFKLYDLAFSAKESLVADELDALIKSPLFERKRELADDYVRNRFSISRDDFIAHGKEKLPADLFHNAVQKISELELKADFILTGFVGDFPEVYYTDGTGVARAANDFAIVGEGEYLAAASLLRRRQCQLTTVDETLYNVWEAKQYANSVASVGKETMLAVLDSEGDSKLVSLNVERQLNKLYSEFGPKELPEIKLTQPWFWRDEKKAAAEAKRIGNTKASG